MKESGDVAGMDEGNLGMTFGLASGCPTLPAAEIGARRCEGCDVLAPSALVCDCARARSL
jgi:hypothetical protein